MSWESVPYPAPGVVRLRDRARGRAGWQHALARPEMLLLLGATAALNLWNLSVNGWANTYYSAAVRSMSTSWHDFLFASMDKSGLMTVDKPPLSLWVQALSARVFGFHPLSILIPEALMGVVAVGLIYDLVRRRFGRAAGCAAGLALALTPITVAVSRHNNPDELLILCCVAALWFAVRAFETGRTRWLVWSGVFVGLGFETKMAVALFVVPGIALAWMWMRWDAPGGRLRALRQLLAGGVAMAVVGLAWPVLVTLTPATDRPWISGTSDNSVWSLIFGYNGVGRVAGQTGGPGGGGGFGGPGGGGGSANSLFGGATGPFRLLQSGLGDQAGWLLGFALVASLGLLVLTRLRRRDPRTGWLIVIGGAFLTTAVVFSCARGIFHPYYLSFLAPFSAALVGAGVGLMLSGRGAPAAELRTGRVLAPLAILAGAVTELVVLGNLSGSLSWAKPLVIAVAGSAAVLLALTLSRRARAVLVGVAMAALLAAPATWAAQTLGHATNGTFPTGGPANAGIGGPGRLGGPGGVRGAGGVGGFQSGRPPVAPGAAGGFSPPGGGTAGPASGGIGAGGGGMFGGDSATLTAAIRYANAHGGGTIGVESQSTAAAAIVSANANVAGLGGFSGRESTVRVAWLAQEVRSGRLRWILTDNTSGLRSGADTRSGSRSALSVAARRCRAVTLPSTAQAQGKMYDCGGRASAILEAAQS